MEQISNLSRPPTKNDIKFIYENFLGYETCPDSAVDYFLGMASVGAVLQATIWSDEFRLYYSRTSLWSRNCTATVIRNAINYKRADDNKSFKVLIYGAYGNGNLGDMEQAKYIESVLTCAGVQENCISCTSWLDLSDYDCKSRQIPWLSIIDPSRLCEFDLIIIGGGGLLGTFPLYDIKWIRVLKEIRLPYIIWSLGIDKSSVEDKEHWALYSELFRGAYLCSGRDDVVVSRMRTVREDAFLFIDSIFYRSLESARHGIKSDKNPDGKRIDFILKYPTTDIERRFIKEFKFYFSQRSRSEVGVIFVEIHNPLEFAMVSDFPGSRHVKTMNELQTQLVDAKLCVSMRYHGVAAALKENVPVIGLFQEKMSNIFQTLDLKDNFFPEEDYGRLICNMHDNFLSFILCEHNLHEINKRAKYGQEIMMKHIVSMINAKNS